MDECRQMTKEEMEQYYKELHNAQNQATDEEMKLCMKKLSDSQSCEQK